ncbi:MAG: hypothetical protein QME44_05525 [Thermodesulfobacteriota bacterium]|nr:hypothetical protein [Thermodesulfobacteriota bacterium]
MKKLLILFTLLILSGCYQEESPAKYQIAVSPSGVAYRLNVTTGEVWSIAPEGLTKLQENKEITLVVGNYYKTEDGKTLKYLGKGQLKHWQPKTAEEFLDKYKK